jgi:long-chain fatty acid transport protein
MKPPKPHSPFGLLFAILAVLLAACADSYGLGIALPDQDAFATARGNAVTATANDPAAVYYNPAGISQLEGINVSIGAYGLAYGDHYNGPFGKIDSRTEWAAYPDIFATFEIPKVHLTLGIGAYTPFGLVNEWPSSAPFTVSGRRGEIDYYTLNPVASWQPIKGLSFAIGPTFNYSQVDIRQNVGLPNNLHFAGRDEAPGFNAGILWQPLPQHSFGISYRSATEMNYSGHADWFNPVDPLLPATYPAKADFKFPQEVDFGYSFRPSEKWNFEADGEWLDWATLKNVNLVASVPGSPTLETLPFNWQSSWIGKLGVTRYLGRDWHVSAGYMYVESSVPSGNFNPLIPDSDRHVFSVGIGQRWHNLSWDAAYQLAWAPSRNVSGDANPLADGNYEFLSHAFTINVGYHF